MGYKNENSGALFKNTEKKTDKHPDYRGSINVGGTDYWLSAWIKKSKDGKTYMSLAVSDKQGGGKKREQDEDSDIPF